MDHETALERLLEARIRSEKLEAALRELAEAIEFGVPADIDKQLRNAAAVLKK